MVRWVRCRCFREKREKDFYRFARGVAIFPFIPKVAVIMVTLSENSTAECSSTTPQINDREHFGSNIVSSTNTEREFPTQPSAASAAINPHQNHPHGLWDLANPELGYEIAASSGKIFVDFPVNCLDSYIVRRRW